jgi:hypothetical protein
LEKFHFIEKEKSFESKILKIYESFDVFFRQVVHSQLSLQRQNFSTKTSSIQCLLNCSELITVEVFVLIYRNTFDLQILSPFYVFQAFSASVWFSDEYEIYASCIVFLSTLSIIVSIYQTRKVSPNIKPKK